MTLGYRRPDECWLASCDRNGPLLVRAQLVDVESWASAARACHEHAGVVVELLVETLRTGLERLAADLGAHGVEG